MRFAHTAVFNIFIAAVLLGCGDTEQVENGPEEPAETKEVAVQSTTPLTSPIDTGLQPDPAYPVPDLAPEELLAYLNQLATMQPRGDTEEEYIADQVSRARSRLIAADRIIVRPGVGADLITAAVQAKLDTLKTLAIMDPHGLGGNFRLFVDALNEGDSPEFARLARISRFWFEVDSLTYGQQQQPEPLVRELKKLLEDPAAGEAEFLATQDGGYVLNDRGFPDQATEVLKLIGARFVDHEELGEEARELIEKTAFREKVIAAMTGDKSEVRTLFLAIRDLLKDKKQLNAETLDNTLNAGQVLEYNGHFDEAQLVFQAIKKAFKECDDDNYAKQAELLVQFAEKRLGVVGQEITIEGVHMDGTPFNWERYRGKVVLVDFWASTSSPWLAELPSLKAAYDQFHEEGFEVVGVNVDRVRENAFNYLRSERLPWPTVVHEVAPGIDANPNAIRYGVRAVPFEMLVGRDGKVADIHLRGPELSQRIKDLLAKPSSKSASEQGVTSVRK